MKKLLIAGILFSGSCKSTESINRFAKSAGSGVSEISRSVISFSGICRLYDPAALAAYRDTSLYARAKQAPVHCGEYKTADSLTRLIAQALVNYFSMLQAVSDKKLLAYQTGNLVSSLSGIQTGINPVFTLNGEKIAALKGLLNSILNEPIRWYRYRKLVRTIRNNDSALARVISAYSFILDSALSGEISQARQNYTSFVYAPLYEWSRTPLEKRMVNREYAAFGLSLDGEQVKVHKAVGMLGTIRKDHGLLASGNRASDFGETASEIARDVLLINKAVEEINQIIK